MSSTRQLKTKIGSVKNIKQITKAMQMVAATKMRRSQETALNARPYARESLIMLLNILKHIENEELPSLFVSGSGEKRNGKSGKEGEVKEKKTALVVMTSDKGLAGSFNSSVLRRSLKWKEEQEAEGKKVEIVAVGKKGRDFFKKQESVMAAEFFGFGDLVTFADVRPLTDWVLKSFESGEYKEISICSTRFISALTQKVEVLELLPLRVEVLEEVVKGIVPKTGKYSELAEKEKSLESQETVKPYFLLEPSKEIILENLVRDLIEVAVTHSVFESNASEHSARMIAMKSATENAERLREELTLKLNKARQSAITQELTEISTAKEALTNG